MTRQRLPPVQAALLSLRATITLTNGSRLPMGLVKLSALCVGVTEAGFIVALAVLAGFAGLEFFATASFGAAVFAAVIAFGVFVAIAEAAVLMGAAFAGAVFITGFATVVFAAEGAICDAGFAPAAALVAGFFAVAALPVVPDCAHDTAAVSIT